LLTNYRGFRGGLNFATYAVKDEGDRLKETQTPFVKLIKQNSLITLN